MLSKESKIRVLENFYALDYVFFGKPVSKVDSCCPLIKEEYISIKGALLSVFVEMIKMIDHNPTSLTEKVNSVVLGQMARESAKIARSNAQKIVSTPKARQNIKEMLKEELKKNPKINISETVEKAITLKAFGLAVDNMLIARTITESENVNSLNEWEGTIVEDSYKILRDNLIESALMILEKDEEEKDEEEKDEEEMSEAWRSAITEDATKLASLGEQINLDEALTDREKSFLFGNIQRMFGDCAKKCGRITIFSKANACKDMCIAKKDQAIKAARAQAKADKAKSKGKIAKAQKYSQKAKDIKSY